MGGGGAGGGGGGGGGRRKLRRGRIKFGLFKNSLYISLL